MPRGARSRTPQQEDSPLSSDMVEKQTGKKDKDKVSLTKTPKLDRSDGGKEVRERATKRKLPFTVGANGEQKDSDTERFVLAYVSGGWESTGICRIFILVSDGDKHPLVHSAKEGSAPAEGMWLSPLAGGSQGRQVQSPGTPTPPSLFLQCPFSALC
uniref:Ankyrin repeat domain containing 11 n=1 Tax=Sciurus vulgaris TaxID=55149 RepID=A0A8D2DQ77_SCIVU